MLKTLRLPKIKFDITPGIIDVNHIQIWQYTQEVLLFEIDCLQKYPEINGRGSVEELYLGANFSTLNIKNKTLSSTHIVIKYLERWIGQYEAKQLITEDKYSFIVAIVKFNDISRNRFINNLNWYKK